MKGQVLTPGFSFAILHKGAMKKAEGKGVLMKELQVIEAEIVSQQSLFDYTALDIESRVIVQQRTSEIKERARKIETDMLQIGAWLADVRSRLENGTFKQWLHAEFPAWSQRKAYYLIQVWEQYGSAEYSIDKIAPSGLYLLAAPSTPAAARETVKRIVQGGQAVSYSTVKEIVAQAKPRKLKQAKQIEEPEDMDRGEEDPPPIEVYVEQSELDEMDRIDACQKIDEGKPVEFYDHGGEPVIITGSVSSGREGMISVEGWRIVPEYAAKDVTPPERGEFETQSYIGTRANIGTKSKPNWWVIVGPQYEFKRKPADKDSSDFRPGFPPGFDPERAEQGLAQEGGPVAVDPSALCLCGCRAGVHTRVRGQYGECCECDCEIFQQATEEEIAERNAAEKALGITPSKSPVPPLGANPTTATITRLKAEMGLEEEEAEKASGEPSTEFFERPAGWFNSPIEIRITLLPGGDAETRKIQYAVRDAAIQFRAAPLTAEDYGEDTLLRLLPDAAYKLVEQLAAEWGKNQWSAVAKKRLKAEAIARWRREPVEMVKLDDEEGDDAPADELETLRNLLALVIENEIPIEAIRRWTDEQKRQAQEWASAAHLRASDHDIEVPARPEILQACICGELGYEHADGICMSDDCGCQQWRPGNYAQCSRCKGEIVTTANLKDFDDLCFNCRVADEEGKSATIELPQEEINRIADLCNAGRLGEKGPLKPLAYVDGHPYLVTGAMGSGDAKNWSKVWAWPVYPPYSLTAKQTNQRTYEETRAEYYKRLEGDNDFHGPIDYNGVKINVGMKKKPNEWVMVGPKVTFVVDGEGTPVQKEEKQTDGEKPALIELPQAEIDRMSEYSASGQIPNEQPVKICHLFNQPHVITGAVWKGEDCLMVFAMPILPLGNFGEEKAKTYSQAVAARRRGGISEALSYEGIKINCGSKKKLDWWVMVRPNKTFTVDYAAAYPNDEIEADPEEVDLPQVEEPTLEAALHHALHHVQNAAERWKPLQYAGADDHELMMAIALEFVGQGGSSQNGGWSVKGGKSPQFTWERDGSTLKGKRLLAKVREVLQIGPPIPAETAPADADDFTAPRCSECGRIDGAHTPECSQSPNKLTFEDYLAYAEFTNPKAPSSWARKWTLSREMDGSVQAWKLHWKELEDSGVTPFLQLCKCGHPLPKHKPEVRCDGKIGDQDCQCVKFVDSAKAEEPKSTKKGRESQ